MCINNLIKIIWIKLSIVNKVIIYEIDKRNYLIIICYKEKYNKIKINKINYKVGFFCYLYCCILD